MKGISLLDIFRAIPCLSVLCGLIFSTADISPYIRIFEKYCYLLDVCPCASIFVIKMLLVASP